MRAALDFFVGKSKYYCCMQELEMNTLENFHAVLAAISSREEFQLDTPVNRAILEAIELLKTSQHRNDIEELLRRIEKEVAATISCQGKPFTSVELWKKKCIPKFHRFRTYQLPQMLQKFPSLPLNHFVWQMVTEHMFFSSLELSTLQQPRPPQRSLDEIEKNAVRHAAGFIVRKLRRKCSQKVPTGLLDKMLHDPTDLDPEVSTGDAEVDDFEAYTKIWTKSTNRGGLLHVTNEAFWLFSEIEIVSYDKLVKCFSGERKSLAVRELAESIAADVDIQFIWSIVSDTGEDMDNEHAQYLLRCIAEEWVALRGHSLTNHFMEQYKLITSEHIKKKKSLRKELKRKTDEDAIST